MKINNILHFNIAVMWKKRIWKNFFSQTLSDVLIDRWMERLSEISIANSVKYQSIFPQWFENDTFNYNYLEQDIIKLYKQGNLEDLLLANWTLDWNGINEFFETNGFSEGLKLLSREQVLDIIEVFKVEEPFLSTRRHLQEFWDYLKERNNNPFILSETLISELKAKDFQHAICTDTRFITELIDFVLNDFYLIKLENEEMIMPEEELKLQHTSELELWHYSGKIWHVFNLYSPEGDYIQWVHRMSYNDLYKYIEDELPRILSFQWYSKETKAVIREIKNKIINDYRAWEDWLLMAQEKFVGKQKDILSKLNSFTELSFIETEEYNELYNNYIYWRDKTLFDISCEINPYYQHY